MANQIYVFHILHEGKHTIQFYRAESEEHARSQLPEGCVVNKMEVK